MHQLNSILVAHAEVVCTVMLLQGRLSNYKDGEGGGRGGQD